MLFISNFVYTLAVSLPVIMFSPTDMDHKEVRTNKPWSVGLFGLEYRPQIIESLTGSVGMGINWDWRYQTFDSESLPVSKISAYESQDPYVDSKRAHKFSFYLSYYLKEESSFFISFLSNVVIAPLEFKVKSKDSYANKTSRTEMEFTVTYIGYGVGVGWHCIWESGFSILVGLDFSITTTSFSHVDSKEDTLQKKVKAAVLEEYEDEHLFPLSSKFMIGYSF